ncbi:hypothetical protein Tco_0579669 [Tanacetum coccineum]
MELLISSLLNTSHQSQPPVTIHQSPVRPSTTEGGSFISKLDSKAWHTIDEKFPKIAKDLRNLRLGISADGVDVNLGTRHHSVWPVLSVIYNLPPWLCMKRKFIMLSVLISGYPGNDIDVFLEPLVDDLHTLFETEVDTYDASLSTDLISLYHELFDHGLANSSPQKQVIGVYIHLIDEVALYNNEYGDDYGTRMASFDDDDVLGDSLTVIKHSQPIPLEYDKQPRGLANTTPLAMIRYTALGFAPAGQLDVLPAGWIGSCDEGEAARLLFLPPGFAPASQLDVLPAGWIESRKGRFNLVSELQYKRIGFHYRLPKLRPLVDAFIVSVSSEECECLSYKVD